MFILFQEDFSDLDDVTGGQPPVTSQPTAGQSAGAGMPVYAMPPPPSTNPFKTGPTENTGLNSSGGQPTYTPGKYNHFE